MFDIKSAMEISSDGNDVLFRCTPLRFRRIHCLCPSATTELQYSHTDLVVRMENGEEAMVEIIQGLLPSGQYQLKMRENVFGLAFSQNSPECINWIKKLVFACWPDIPVCDMYGGNVIQPPSI